MQDMQLYEQTVRAVGYEGLIQLSLDNCSGAVLKLSGCNDECNDIGSESQAQEASFMLVVDLYAQTC